MPFERRASTCKLRLRHFIAALVSPVSLRCQVKLHVAANPQPTGRLCNNQQVRFKDLKRHGHKTGGQFQTSRDFGILATLEAKNVEYPLCATQLADAQFAQRSISCNYLSRELLPWVELVACGPTQLSSPALGEF